MKGEAIMITSLHPLGRISLTNRYFTDLVSRAAQSSFGVAGMFAMIGLGVYEVVVASGEKKTIAKLLDNEDKR